MSRATEEPSMSPQQSAPSREDVGRQESARMDQGTGRHATSPAGVPPQGWKSILKRMIDSFSRDRVMLVAAGATFYLLLALVPGMAALVSIYGLFSDPSVIQDHLSRFEAVLPPDAMTILNDQLSRLAARSSSDLSLRFALSLGVALWSANAGVKALFEAMNVAYNEQEKRGFFRLTLATLTFTIGMLIFSALAVALLLLLPPLLGILAISPAVELLLRIGGILIMLLIAIAGVSMLYRWGPSRTRARWLWISPGAVLTVLVWIAASVAYSWYVSNMASNDATYGSLGTIIGFMVWLWISLVILVTGAELNSEIEAQTAEDSTTGKPRPMGDRGAYVADNLGEQ